MLNSKVEEELRRATIGPVRFGEEARLHIEQALWNGDMPTSVDAVADCRSVGDVRRVVRVAAENGQPVAVLAGGHDWAGRAGSPRGISLDLRDMNRVSFDPISGTATFGGGALINDLLEALPYDQAVVAGTISTVGMTALTLGGGYGKLNSRFGLALDNLVRAEVVLSNGTVAIASEQDDGELFWALRGGGGNFGVVTSLTMSVHRLPKVLTGLVFVPLPSARDGLLGMQSILDDNDDDLSIFSALMTGPSGDRGLVLGPLWSGEEHAGDRVMRSIAGLPSAQVLAQSWSTVQDTYSKEFEAGWPKGRGYVMDAVNIARLDEAAADALVDCAHRLPSAADCIMLHDFHGACTRVRPDATAFPLRTEHFNVQILAGWEKGGDSENRLAWTEATRTALDPLSIRGGYPNILGPQADARERAHAFYGEAVGRLQAAKLRYDPLDMFRSNMGRL